jgi:hypothetical protein
MGRPEKVLIICGGKAEGNDARKKAGATASLAVHRNNFTPACIERSGPEFTSRGEGLGHQSFERDKQKIVKGVGGPQLRHAPYNVSFTNFFVRLSFKKEINVYF